MPTVRKPTDEALALERVVNAARAVQAALTALQPRFAPDGDGQPSTLELVAFEVAMTLVLLVGAGLMLRSLSALWRADSGFIPSHAITFNVSMPSSAATTSAETRARLRANHVRRILREWIPHYNTSRPHMSLGPGMPQPPASLPVPLQAHRHRLALPLKIFLSLAFSRHPNSKLIKIVNQSLLVLAQGIDFGAGGCLLHLQPVQFPAALCQFKFYGVYLAGCSVQQLVA